jgi:predicted NUDIX family phosphoesterase
MPLFGSFMDTYQAAVQREVAEEVIIEAAHSDRIIALINDDSTEVGRVHLGIVHHWELEAPHVTRREQMITQLGFLTADELRTLEDSLESWSRFCLDLLPRLQSNAMISTGRSV